MYNSRGSKETLRDFYAIIIQELHFIFQAE